MVIQKRVAINAYTAYDYFNFSIHYVISPITLFVNHYT